MNDLMIIANLLHKNGVYKMEVEKYWLHLRLAQKHCLLVT